MNGQQMQMAMFAEVTALRPEAQPTPPPHPVVVETSVVLRCECGARAALLLGDGGYCEPCLVKALRARKLLDKTSMQPLILRCDGGFRRVRRGQALDFAAQGDVERVQTCAECKGLHRVGRWWTGEPSLCPACSSAAFREVYPGGWR